MKHLKKSLALLMLLTVIISSRTFAQEYFNFSRVLGLTRAQQVMQDNEYTSTGNEQGSFSCNPLMLNEKPLDYNAFSLKSKGELSVVKGAAVTGHPTQIPFHAYLRRSGNIVVIPGGDRPDPGQTKIEISEILKYAKPGDQLVIEPVLKEDGPAKRILKLLAGGC